MKLKKNNINYINSMIKILYILYLLFLLIAIYFIKKYKLLKKNSNLKEKCYLPSDHSNLKIIHFIITRFKLGFATKNDTTKDYTLNGIRVMKKYLLPSLENQSCKDFNWILLIGDKVNITFLKSLFTFNISFQWYIIYKKDIKKFLKNITKGFDIFITTRIDYDDLIYYDAVNDVRKQININRPIFFYGYNRGAYFIELDNKYYNFEMKNKNGAHSIFESSIIILNQVNDTYTIYDFGSHVLIREKFFKNYKSYGINELNYEPTIFDFGAPKFVYVRQKHSLSYSRNQIQMIKKNNKIINFNLSRFFG